MRGSQPQEKGSQPVGKGSQAEARGTQPQRGVYAQQEGAPGGGASREELASFSCFFISLTEPRPDFLLLRRIREFENLAPVGRFEPVTESVKWPEPLEFCQRSVKLKAKRCMFLSGSTDMFSFC